jgi:hypothetical protein
MTNDAPTASTKKPRGGYARAIVRLSAFLIVCGAVLGYVDYREARATVMDRLLGIGSRMAPYLDDGRATEAPRMVRVNGVRLFLAAGHTEQPPSFVRKWYTERYQAKGAEVAQAEKLLRAKGILPPSAPGLNQLAFGNEQKGGVAALDFGEPMTMRLLKDRMSRFVGKGDLGSIARLRYVYYEKTGTGGTRFLTVWTDDSFRLSGLMPTDQKDADGFDLDNVPRYPGTVRVLSAEERGMPQRMAVYDGPGSPETALLFYRARMKSLGWMEDETFGKLAARQGKQSLKFGSKDGHEVVLDLSRATADGGLTICALQTR